MNIANLSWQGLLITPLLLVTAQASTHQPLLVDEDVTVSVDTNRDCRPKMSVTIESRTPELFEQESNHMQSLVDASRAILRYECPELSVLEIEGKLSGLPRPVFEGVADAGTQWQVTSSRTISVESATEHGALAQDVLPDKAFSIATLSIGMTVEQVRQAMLDQFSVDPDYDPVDGYLYARAPGCPGSVNDVITRPEDVEVLACLEAWFTDARVATMSRLLYMQITKGSVADASEILIENFGVPDEDFFLADNFGRRMSWTGNTGEDEIEDRVVNERLTATLNNLDGDVMVTLELFDPSNSQDQEVAGEHVEQDAVRPKLKL